MRRKRIGWLPVIVIVLVGLYLRSARQAPPVKTNNTRATAVPAPQVPPHTESHAHLHLKVVSVHDGDTITGLDEDQKQFKIRLDAIDAPELGMAFGQASRKALSEKVLGKQVEVIVKTKDRYGRTVGHVLLDRRDMNLEMLEEGMAWHYAHYDHNKRLAAAEGVTPSPNSEPVLVRESSSPMWGLKGFSDEEATQCRADCWLASAG